MPISYWRSRIIALTGRATHLAEVFVATGAMKQAHILSLLSASTWQCYKRHDYVQSIAVLSILECYLNHFGNNYQFVAVRPQV